MRVQVHQRGGVLGVDNEVEVGDDGAVRVKERGVVRDAGLLERSAHDEVEKLAARAIAASPVVPGDDDGVVDAMSTEIMIVDDDGVHAIRLRSGDGVPAPVRDLIRALRALSRNAPSTPRL